MDVAVKRWESLTDKKATLEGSCGQTFEHVRDGRRMEAEDSIKEDALRLIEERA